MENKKRKMSVIVALFILCLAAVVFLPNTGPFRSHSIWCMTHDYFNFAKSILDGKVLYTDLFDHKGLFLFVLYFIPVWISKTSTIGIFIMEGIVLIGITLSCYHFCSYRYRERTSICITGLVLLLLRLVFPEIWLNTEPLCIILIFVMLRYIDTQNYAKYKVCDYVLFGMSFAALFWMKYPMVIVLFPFWLYIAIFSVKTGKLKCFMQRCMISFLAFTLFSAPIVGYFIYHGNLYSMVESYFTSVHADVVIFTGSLLEYSVFIILFISATGFCIVKNYRENNRFFMTWFFIIFAITNFLGGVRAYTSCFVVIFIAMFLPELLSNKIGRFIAVLGLGTIFLFNVPLLNQQYNGYRSVEEIASDYEITNDNVLYLFEDMGFGTYGEAPYRHKYQWKPARISYDDNDEIYEQTMEWIESKEFKYLCVSQFDLEYDIDIEELGNNHRMANVILAVRENYEVVEAFDFNEGKTDVYYLCVAK